LEYTRFYFVGDAPQRYVVHASMVDFEASASALSSAIQKLRRRTHREIRKMMETTGKRQAQAALGKFNSQEKIQRNQDNSFELLSRSLWGCF